MAVNLNLLRRVDRRILISLAVTAAILVPLLFIGRISAVNLEVVGCDPSVATLGDSVTCEVTLSIQNSERIPIQNLQFVVDGPTPVSVSFDPFGAILSQDPEIESITLLSGINPGFGYGYGYGEGPRFGYDNQTGYGYDFGPGFGYGYGYGYQFAANAEFRYEIVISTVPPELGAAAVSSGGFAAATFSPAPNTQGGYQTPPNPVISAGGEMGGQGVPAPEGGAGGDPTSQPLQTETDFAPGVITQFDGPGFDDNGAKTGFLFIPPDPSAAAGPAHVVSVVNVLIEWRSKDGTLQSSDTLQEFFAPLSPANFTFDPKVIYDQYAGRFVVVTLERVDTLTNPDPGNISRILLAVSDDSDPNGIWFFHAIDAKLTPVPGGTEFWFDYPGFAVDEEAVYISGNYFGFVGAPDFAGPRLWIVNKGLASGFYSGGAASQTFHDPAGSTGGIPATIQPAHMFGAGPAGVGTFLVSYSGLTTGGPGGTEAIQVIRVDDPVGTPIFTLEFVDVGDLEDVGGSFGPAFLPDAPQSGSAVGIAVNDRRALNAVWRDDALWMTATINPNSGPDAGQTTARWFKLDTSTLGATTVADQGNVGGENIASGAFTFFPSIAVNSQGDMAIGFAVSAPTIFPSAAYSGRLASDLAGTVQPSVVYRPGLAFYERVFNISNRWGDYSGMSVDPADDLTFWVFNEYAQTQGTPTTPPSPPSGEGRWGTAYASFVFDVTPPELQSAAVDDTTLVLTYDEVLNDSSDPATGAFVIITGGAAQTVSAADATGTAVTLTLDPGVVAGDNIAINYTAASAGGTPIEDTAGNDAADLVSQPVINNTPSVPGAPTNVVATAGDAEATITWDAPADDGGSAITGYVVTADPPDVSSLFVGVVLTTDMTGLTNGTSYTFTVSAVNDVGTGLASVPSSAVTPATVPDAPTNVFAAPGDEKATITWDTPAFDGGSSITGYVVTADPPDVSSLFVGDVPTSATVTGLTNGTSYTFTVSAENDVGTGPASADSNPVTPASEFIVNSPLDLIDNNIADGVCETSTPGECTLRAAIQQANANPGADIIILPADNYTLSIGGAGENNAATGDLDITDDLTINGAGQLLTIIDGGALDRVFDLPVDSTVVISGVTVQNGVAEVDSGGGISNLGTLDLINSTIKDNFAGENGGGIFNSNTLTLAGSTVDDNGANNGGGIYNDDTGVLTLTNSTITDNSAVANGGGIINFNTLTLMGSTVDDNDANDGGGIYNAGAGVLDVANDGGGIFNAGAGVLDLTNSTITNNLAGARGGGIINFNTLTLTGSTVDDNVASDGGGIYNVEGVLTLIDSTINGNTALTAGGIYNVFSVVGTVATLTNSTVSRNTTTGETELAGHGGGILNSATLTLTNSTVSGNSTSPGHAAGGILNCGDFCGGGPIAPVLTINNSTVIGNSSELGGGIASDTGGTVTILNTIVAGNIAATGPDCVGTVGSSGTNLIGNGSNCTFGVNTGDLVGNDLLPINPVVGLLQDNGGPTETHALLAGSPAIDAGNDSVLLPPLSLTTDQRGLARLQSLRVDIGAFEALAPPGAPTDVAATAGNGEATVTWTAPADAGGDEVTGYTVTTNPATVPPLSVGDVPTSATVTGLTNGTPYTFTVVANSLIGDGPASIPSNSVTPSNVPGAPINVSATAGNAEATITWNAPADDGGSPITDYIVTSNPASPSSGLSVGDVLSTTMTGLTNGTSYTFTVSAVNANAEGPASVPSSPVTPATVPGAPTNVVATAGAGQASITWSAPADDGGSAITGYVVTSNPASPNSPLLVDPVLFGVTGDGASTPETLYTIDTTDASTTLVTFLGNGNDGEEIAFNPLSGLILHASGFPNQNRILETIDPDTLVISPLTVSGDPQNEVAGLTFAGGGDFLAGDIFTSGPETGLFRISSSGGSTRIGDTDHIATGLAFVGGTLYSVSRDDFLRTVDAATGATISSIGITVDGSPINKATALTTHPVTGELFAVINSGPGSRKLATIDPATGVATVIGALGDKFAGITFTFANVLTATMTGLTNGTPYTFTVSAVNAEGTGPPSTASNSVTPTAAPAAPTNVSATAGNTAAAINWVAPADDGGIAITSYVVTSSPASPNSPLSVGNVLTATMTGLTNGTSYTFTVSAVNAIGEGLASAPSAAATPFGPMALGSYTVQLILNTGDPGNPTFESGTQSFTIGVVVPSTPTPTPTDTPTPTPTDTPTPTAVVVVDDDADDPTPVPTPTPTSVPPGGGGGGGPGGGEVDVTPTSTPTVEAPPTATPTVEAPPTATPAQITVVPTRTAEATATPAPIAEAPPTATAPPIIVVPTPTAEATPTSAAVVTATATPAPTAAVAATPVPEPTPVPVLEEPVAGFPVGAIIAIVLGVIAVIAVGGFLYLRSRGRLVQT